MNAIFAAHFAGEIAAVTEEGGEALLSRRVAALDDVNAKCCATR
jgi:hypothetical protein